MLKLLSVVLSRRANSCGKAPEEHRRQDGDRAIEAVDAFLGLHHQQHAEEAREDREPAAERSRSRRNTTPSRVPKIGEADTMLIAVGSGMRLIAI